ncbi:MAG: MoaD/ThiS family protein [Pirellulales bacterium]
MQINVQLFAVARQRAGSGSIELELPSGATVAMLRVALVAAVPTLADTAPHLRFAVNSDYAADATVIPADAQVACIPPVSGG